MKTIRKSIVIEKEVDDAIDEYRSKQRPIPNTSETINHLLKTHPHIKGVYKVADKGEDGIFKHTKKEQAEVEDD